jgi:hypothetical protein
LRQELQTLDGRAAGRKLEKLITSIRRNELIAFSIAVNYRDFNRIVREQKGVLKNPDGIAFAHILVG